MQYLWKLTGPHNASYGIDGTYDAKKRRMEDKTEIEILNKVMAGKKKMKSTWDWLRLTPLDL